MRANYSIIILLNLGSIGAQAELSPGDLLRGSQSRQEEAAPIHAQGGIPLLPSLNTKANANEKKKEAPPLLEHAPAPAEKGLLSGGASLLGKPAEPVQEKKLGTLFSKESKNDDDDDDEEGEDEAPNKGPSLKSEAPASTLFAAPAPSPAPASTPVAQPEKKPEYGALQISKYRFRYHKREEFERLVLEFKQRHAPLEPATVKVTPGKNGFTIDVANFALEGSIPEYKINKSYSKKSYYIGEISFSSDSNHKFVIAVQTKNRAQLDAFWLESPHRLVVDAFPEGSTRASGMALSQRVVSSTGNPGEAATTAAATAPATPPPPPSDETMREPNSTDPSVELKEKEPKKPGLADKFACYIAQSQVQVTAAMIYKPAIRWVKGKPQLRVEVEGAPSALPPGVSPSDIVCYPKASRVAARVYYGEVAADRPSLAPRQTVQVVEREVAAAPLASSPFGGFSAPSAALAPAAPPIAPSSLFGNNNSEPAASPKPVIAAPLGKLPTFK